MRHAISRRSLLGLTFLATGRGQGVVPKAPVVCGCDEADEEYLGYLALGAIGDALTSRIVVRRDLQLNRCKTCGVLSVEENPVGIGKL